MHFGNMRRKLNLNYELFATGKLAVTIFPKISIVLLHRTTGLQIREAIRGSLRGVAAESFVTSQSISFDENVRIHLLTECRSQ